MFVRQARGDPPRNRMRASRSLPVGLYRRTITRPSWLPPSRSSGASARLTALTMIPAPSGSSTPATSRKRSLSPRGLVGPRQLRGVLDRIAQGRGAERVRLAQQPGALPVPAVGDEGVAELVPALALRPGGGDVRPGPAADGVGELGAPQERHAAQEGQGQAPRPPGLPGDPVLGDPLVEQRQPPFLVCQVDEEALGVRLRGVLAPVGGRRPGVVVGALHDVEGLVDGVALGTHPEREEHPQAMVAGDVVHLRQHLQAPAPGGQGDGAGEAQVDRRGGAGLAIFRRSLPARSG